MVDKPSEGKCSECGSENLQFFDDGSGKCPDCGRTFTWASQPQQTQTQPSTQQTTAQPQRTQAPQQSKTQKSSSNKKTIRRKKSSSKKKKNKIFLWISAAGFIMLAIGYGLIFSIQSAIAFETTIDNANGLMLIGQMLNYIGIIVVGLGLTYGAATAEYLDAKVRAWMLAAMAILLGLFLTFGMFSSSILGGMMMGG